MKRPWFLVLISVCQGLGGVPTNAELPAWTKSFKLILAARVAKFDAIDASALTLSGADSCSIGESGAARRTFTCIFLEQGKSNAEVQNEYIRLVRLVQKATGLKVQRPSEFLGYVTETRKSPMAKGITVTAFWTSSEALVSSLEVEVASEADPTLKNVQPDPDDISAIMISGEYTLMHPSQRETGNGTGPISIHLENATGHSLTIVYFGVESTPTPTPNKFYIFPSAGVNVSIPAGSYRILGRVSAPNVLPFVGREDYRPGEKLNTTFSLRRY